MVLRAERCSTYPTNYVYNCTGRPTLHSRRLSASPSLSATPIECIIASAPAAAATLDLSSARSGSQAGDCAAAAAAERTLAEEKVVRRTRCSHCDIVP